MKKYADWIPEVARSLYRLGHTDAEVAEVLGLARSTLFGWAKRYPEFAAARAGGKALADARVEDALFRRAVGYDYDERTFEGTDEKSAQLVKRVRKHVVPDSTACFFWLCNRRPDLWRHVNRVEFTGADGGPIQHEHDLSRLSDAELEAEIVAEAERIKDAAASGGACPPPAD